MQIIRRFQEFSGDEAGVTAIEYALIAALIGVSVIAGMTAIGTSINAVFTTLSAAV